MADFRLVSMDDVDFEAPAAVWLKGGVYHAARTQASHAVLACEGDVLTTKHGRGDLDVISYNIAQKGDWKITTKVCYACIY